jgi:protein-disulfide isomerase
MVGDRVPEWDALLAGGIRQGSEDAPVEIVEFMDFQCPFCRVYHRVLDSLMAVDPDGYAVTYRHLPLSYHPAAPAAAALSTCADKQGVFKRVADAIYQHQDQLNDVAWATVLEDLGGEQAHALEECMFSDLAVDAVRLDEALARRLEISATPTLFVNGYRMNSPPSADSLSALLARARAGEEVFAGRSLLDRFLPSKGD